MTRPSQTDGLRSWTFATFGVLACCATATAQAPSNPRSLGSLSPAGARSYLTENWGAMEFSLSNPTARDMEARILTYYADAAERQFGRDAWVPSRSTLWSWYTIGPPPTRPVHSRVELKTLVYDRTTGQDRLLRSADGQPLHSNLARFERREPGTAVMLDADIADGSQSPLSPAEQTRADEVRDLVRILRSRRGLSERVAWVRQRCLPPAAEAMDGVDHFVLASNRLADDVAGRRTLREWLHRGGSLWVLLDFVEVNTVAALLGDAVDLQAVDRTTLTRVEVASAPDHPSRTATEPLNLDEPVDLVRVTAPRQRVLYTVNGWPAAFVMDVGRGRVLFTTLGARGWMRPRTDRDPPSPYREFPRLPIPFAPFEFLAVELQPRSERPPLGDDDLRGYVSEQIGYAVVGRATVLSVFSVFFAGLLVASAGLGSKGWLEHLGWLGPAAALFATGFFVGLGEWSRSAVPPTVAVVQFVDAEPGLEEAQASGFFAVYQPSLAISAVGVDRGGQFDLDVAGLEGRVHRRVQTDLDRWRWEDLELPAGVRMAPFQHTVRTTAPIQASARFGPDGVEGNVLSGPFGQLEDALLNTPGPHTATVRLNADGSFTCRSEDELPAGKLSIGALLKDKQRARQRFYENLLTEPLPRHLANRGVLLGWADPVDMHFNLAPRARTTGSALLAIPLRFEHTLPNTRVTVPGAFVDCRRVTDDGRSYRPSTEARAGTTMRLRFQLPDAVMPLVVENARLSLKLHAPGREVVLAAAGKGDAVTLRTLSGPLGVEQVDINDPALLVPDDRGALYVTVQIGNIPGASTDQDVWRMSSVGLEVRGRTVGGS